MAKVTKISNRGHLKNLVKKGLIEAKCDFHLTDDYAFDSAYNFGKDENWLPVEHVEDLRDGKNGFISLSDWDFGTKSGGLYRNGGESSCYTFYIHSNLSYTLRIKEVA